MKGEPKDSLAVSRAKALRNQLIYRREKLKERLRAGRSRRRGAEPDQHS